uniref:Uncharacterized protein n=1 Tax=Romanomermis culicivorax TaxID=13658 RepID=A0A915J1L8_ROMCU
MDSTLIDGKQEDLVQMILNNTGSGCQLQPNQVPNSITRGRQGPPGKCSDFLAISINICLHQSCAAPQMIE